MDAPAGRDLPEDMHEEFLLRLPAKDVLRFRAVCKAWRRIADDPRFIAAHARRRPLELIVSTETMVPAHRPRDRPDDGYDSKDVALETIPVSAADDEASRRPRCLMRYPYHINNGIMSVLASCDGFLLLTNSEMLLVCNPATRQWAELPQFPATSGSNNQLLYVMDYRFYHHQASGEHRILCRCGMVVGEDVEVVYYVLSTASTEPRRLVSVADADDEAAASAIAPSTSCWWRYPRAAVNGWLYWLVPPPDDTHHHDYMLAFDTASETFHMTTPPPPPTTSSRAELVDILAMDGRLVAAGFGKMRIDLWFLEDHDDGGANNGRWERRHRIDTAPIYAELRRRLPAGVTPTADDDDSLWDVDDGEVAVAGTEEGDIVLRSLDGLVVHNVKTKASRVVMDFEQVSSWQPLVYRESLVRLQRLKSWSPDA